VRAWKKKTSLVRSREYKTTEKMGQEGCQAALNQLESWMGKAHGSTEGTASEALHHWHGMVSHEWGVKRTKRSSDIAKAMMHSIASNSSLMSWWGFPQLSRHNLL